jgi:predicted DNA-binding transcriptional regulator AlpA
MTTLFFRGTMDKVKYITRREIATRTQLSIETIKRLCDEGKLPEPIRNNRFIHYNRKEGEQWIKDRNALGLKPQVRDKGNKDVWCIRNKRDPFVYSGRTLMHILFCQPALRNGRHSYEDCK